MFATARSLKSLTNLSEAGIEVFALDVTSLQSITALKEDIATLTGGKLDILYNNAGVRTFIKALLPARCLQGVGSGTGGS